MTSARRWNSRRSAMAVALAVTGGSAAILGAPAASAATIWYVAAGATSTACTQASPCGTITKALGLAASGDTIKVGAGTYTGTYSVPIGMTITIEGAGASSTVLNGNKAGSVAFVPSSAKATLSNLTLTGGSTAGYGGGVYAEGSLTLNGVKVTGNTTNLNGGGVYTGPSATLTINDSWFTANTAAGEGGGMHVGGPSATMRNVTVSGNTSTGWGSTNGGGGISTTGHLDLENVTVTGNKATASMAQGGGILFTPVISLGAKLTAKHITVSANTASTGGGIASPDARSADVSASIITGNSSGNCTGLDATGTYNLTDDSGSGCGMSGGEHDLVSTDPALGALTDNGGTTLTQAIGSGSPAHEAVPSSTGFCTGTDQHGVTRLYLYGSACDIGAYQYLPAAPKASLSATALGFGSQGTGTTAAKTVTLTNAGTRPLGLSSATVTGTGFSVSSTTCLSNNQPVPLAAGASCQITVAFAPTTLGFRTGTLTLADNDGETQDPAGSAQTVTLSGTGSIVTPTTTPTPTATPTATATATTSPSPTGNPPAVGWIGPMALGSPSKGSTYLGLPGLWNGTSPIVFAPSWERCDSAGANCTTISGGTGWTYTVTAADVGYRLRLNVLASNPDGFTTAYSAVTNTIQ